MRTLETERLILRKFQESDFAAVHSYASRADNLTYLTWGPNSEENTKAFLAFAIAQAEEAPCTNYQYAAVLKANDQLIGAINLTLSGREAETGWILHKAYWNQGYGTEMAAAVLRFGFHYLNLHRILAHCDAENIGSYRVMEKIGMRREGVFLKGRPAHKGSEKEYGDELSYAFLKEEWEARKIIT
ncbi:MAG: GNAT family N-acetyltransferase [Clostridiales bacterium]|nr:GNAT family N-acetyltransferase [Clostridiales bacterium]